MGYYLPKLQQVIRTRLVGDSTLRGQIASGSVRWNELDRDTAVPYIALVLTGTDPEVEGFKLAGKQVDVDVHIFVPSQNDNASTPTVAASTLATVSDRIEGDWDEQTGIASPTYGLNRWQPTLTGTNWNCTHMQWITTSVLDEPGLLHHVHTFRCFPNKAQA